MANKALRKALIEQQSDFDPTQGIDCGCVIHGQAYDWTYVEKLWSMLNRHFSYPVRLHVWTERSRPVPPPFIRHDLEDWPGISGPRRAWWYKMQMFDPKHFMGQMLYFDLDVVIVDNLDWIVACDRRYFWTLKDFKYLWRPQWNGMNSSVMYWDTARFPDIWQAFIQNDPLTVSRYYPGDQDFLSKHLVPGRRQFFNELFFQSWRWQVHDGGMDMKNRPYASPGAGAVIPAHTKVIIFHGRPKPMDVVDPIILKAWQ